MAHYYSGPALKLIPMFSIIGRRRGEGGGTLPCTPPIPSTARCGAVWIWKALLDRLLVWMCGRCCLALLGDNEHRDTSRLANVPGCVGGQEGQWSGNRYCNCTAPSIVWITLLLKGFLTKSSVPWLRCNEERGRWHRTTGIRFATLRNITEMMSNN